MKTKEKSQPTILLSDRLAKSRLWQRVRDRMLKLDLAPDVSITIDTRAGKDGVCDVFIGGSGNRKAIVVCPDALSEDFVERFLAQAVADWADGHLNGGAWRRSDKAD